MGKKITKIKKTKKKPKKKSKNKAQKLGAYQLSWKFLCENKKFILAICLIFILSAIFGYIFPIFFAEFIKRFIEETMSKTEGMGFFQLFIFILQNNLTAAFIGLILGVAIGIVPIIFAFFNGYVLGFIMNKTAEAAGSSILLRLLPHGIFELPAFVLSLSLGLRLGIFAFKKSKNRKKEFIYSLENSLRVFIFIILPLFFIAALIESALIMLL